MTTRTFKSGRMLFAAAGLALAVGACQPMVDLRGNHAEADDLRTIQVGLTTKQEVARKLGSPSNVSPFDKNAWYYISKREEHYAFFKPDVKQQQVVEIRFNEEGVVENVKRYGLGDSRKVDLVSRQTKSRGGEPGMLRSLWDTFTRSRIGKKRTNKLGI
ncbi:MAG: outer membrane protein assembly factor BamE [Bauldia litoralis]